MRWVALLLLAPLACDPAPGGGGSDGAPGTAEPAAESAAPSASASAAGPASPHAGEWSGSFKAAKGEVEVPKGVRYKAWTEDDGSAMVGEGKLKLSIADDGEVKGTASGALGELEIRGRVEDDTLRAGVTPVDPEAERAVRGTLVGDVKGKDIVADFRVSSGDANTVRVAQVKLARD